MSELDELPPRRKVLTLPKIRSEEPGPSQWVHRQEAVYMVWCETGDMPRRLYSTDEAGLAYRHAAYLAAKTGNRFHVLRSWRIVMGEAAGHAPE